MFANLKLISITAAIALIVGYTIGYIHHSTPQVTEKTSETQVSVDDKTTQSTTTTTQVKEPNGAEKTTTTIVSTTHDVGGTKTLERQSLGSTTNDPVGKYHIWGLAIKNPGDVLPDYGIGASARVLGPIDIGAVVLKSGSIGLTIGVSF